MTVTPSPGHPLLSPNATGYDVLLYLDADCIVSGNLDAVFTSFPYTIAKPLSLSSVGDLGYWNSGVMLPRSLLNAAFRYRHSSADRPPRTHTPSGCVLL